MFEIPSPEKVTHLGKSQYEPVLHGTGPGSLAIGWELIQVKIWKFYAKKKITYLKTEKINIYT